MNKIRKYRLDPYGHLVIVKLKNTKQYGILKDKTYFTEKAHTYILYTVFLYNGGSYKKQLLRATEFDVVKIYDYDDIYLRKNVRKDKLDPKNKLIIVDTITQHIGVLLSKFKKENTIMFEIDCCEEDNYIIECKTNQFNVIDIIE